jgi:hypothetical protein
VNEGLHFFTSSSTLLINTPILITVVLMCMKHYILVVLVWASFPVLIGHLYVCFEEMYI